MKVNSSNRRVVSVTAALMALFATTAAAQTERGDCPGDAAALRAQPRNAKAMWAMSTCPSTGPVALAGLWAQRGVADATPVATLVDATGALRDKRLFDAVMRTASAPDRPRADRLSALLALMRYYNPDYAPYMEHLAESAYRASVPVRIGGPVPMSGSAPLSGMARPRIAQLFAQLAANDGDAAVRQGALRMRQVLARADPANTPLPAGSIALIAGCSSRVTLRSTADVEVEVRLRVLDTAFDKAYGILAGSAASPRNLFLSLPSGTVVATFAGREVARLSERNAPCPPGMVRW